MDHGNSAAKVGIFDNESLVEKYTFADTEALRGFLEQADVRNVIVSSVGADAKTIASWAVRARGKLVLSTSLPLPVQSRYKTPETLGVDRLAGVCGARNLFPGRNCLVIDAGTCVTYDLVDQNGTYWGGAIAPGLTMRFKAVHTFTARLPLISPGGDVQLVGDSTESCIRSGVINGLLAEMHGMIERYEAEFNDLQVLLCGGDTSFFENKLKASIFASPELVLIGLNSILKHNAID